MSYHFAVSIVSYLSFRATILLCAGPFAADILKTAAEYDGTVIYGSPVHYDLMAHAKNAPHLPNLRLAISTTTALQPETADAFAARFGRPLVQAYGIIEIGLPCINTDRPGEKKTAVGHVLPAYRIRLNDVGAGDGRKAIQFCGPGFIDAYYEPFRRREEIMIGGWFDTGDLGLLDKDGCLHILGRAKEMISIGGMKFFPQETEDVLAAHPMVAEACVFACADKRLGEIGAARVVLTKDAGPLPDEKELKDFCALRLAAYKVPDRIEFVDKLPRTASGKPLRRDLHAPAENGKGTAQ
jgi:long-chain acyl-CoA synthetase